MVKLVVLASAFAMIIFQMLVKPMLLPWVQTAGDGKEVAEKVLKRFFKDDEPKSTFYKKVGVKKRCERAMQRHPSCKS